MLASKQKWSPATSTSITRLSASVLVAKESEERTSSCSVSQRRSKRRAVEVTSFEQDRRLKKAVSEYAEGVKKGIAEDDIVALQLGAQDISELTESQQAYVNKIKAKLAKEAEEERLRKEQHSLQFVQGKKAYSTGQYAASELLFSKALEMEGELSPLGGEIQLWLALAFQACGKESRCIDLYKSVEKNHPLPRIKRQAAELRYIMEAPKLKIGPDERVKLPILQDQSRFGRQRGYQSRSTPRPPALQQGKKPAKTFEEEFWESYKPPLPDVAKNKYFWIATGLIAAGLAWYSTLLNRVLVHGKI